MIPPDRILTKSDGPVRVSVAVLSFKESEAVFGTAVYNAEVQPVWIRIENNDSVPYIHFPNSVDPHKFSPLEAAYRNHSRFSSSTNADMDEYFLDNSLERIIPPGGTISGFVYTNLDLGTKEVQVMLLGPQRIKQFIFLIPVPGLHTHYSEVHFDKLYHPDEIKDYDEEGLHKALEALPCCATNAQGTREGDPINIVLVGEREAIFSALIDRNWDLTEKIYTGSVWREVNAFLFGAPYRYAPFSPLYLYHRRQDVSLQRPRQTVAARNHLRLWLAPMRFAGRPVWVGQVSRDIGVRFTPRTWNFTTHKIDPNIDEARGHLVEDLLLSRRVTKLGFVKGGNIATLDAPRANLTGDTYVTDGFRAVLLLSEEIAPTIKDALFTLQAFGWEWPDAISLDGSAPWHNPP